MRGMEAAAAAAHDLRTASADASGARGTRFPIVCRRSENLASQSGGSAAPERRRAEIHGASPYLRGDEPELSVEDVLTAREREVVTLIALGEDTAGIARELHVSPETVKTHVRNAMAKLGVHTRAQLVAVSLGRQLPARLPRLG
jgi:DNA-binding NarL/FixJ family response regulator